MITKIILHSYDEEDDDNRENEEERISSCWSIVRSEEAEDEYKETTSTSSHINSDGEVL